MTLDEITTEIKTRETALFNYIGKFAIHEHSQEPCFSGCIDLLTTADIQLGYNPKYEEEARELEKIVDDPFEAAFSALTRHELNHKGGGTCKGCPRSIDLHIEKILDPIAETLAALGFANVPVQGQGLYSYFANLFEDVVDNFELGAQSNMNGIFLLYKDGAEHQESKKFSHLFDAFVEIQERLYAGKRAKKLMRQHHTGAKEVKEAVDKCMERSGLTRHQRTITTRRKKQAVTVFDRKKAKNYLLNEENWTDVAKIMTEEFVKLIDKNQLQNPEYVRQTFLPLKGEADTFKDEMNDPEVKMRFAFKKYQKPGNSFEPPKYMENFEALDLVYQRLARDMEIRTRTSTRSETMPTTWFGRKPFDPTKDKLARVRIGINSNAKLELRVKKYHTDEQIEYTESRSNLPEIKLVLLDTSESTQSSLGTKSTKKVMNPWAEKKLQWHDDSVYHYELLGWYSLIEYLKKQGTLKHTSVKLVNYSNTTYSAENLAESKRSALQPQFGGTTFDLPKVRKLFGRGQLIFSLSDGGIENWNSIKEEYIRRAKQNQYVHIQIGNATQMSQDLDAAGLRVIPDDGTNIGKIMIDFTRPIVTRGRQ